MPEGIDMAKLEERLHNHGIKVVHVKGWKERGDGFFEPHAVMFHHTASSKLGGNAPSLAVVTNGRIDLDGPLCQILVGRNGTAYFIAKGRANHAGFGGPFRNIPKDSGNAYIFGVEVENDGVGEPWSENFKQQLATIFACILRSMDKGPDWLLGHKEWAPGRKIDPANVEMAPFRSRVKGFMDKEGWLKK